MMMVTVTLGIACGGMIINQGSPIVQLKFGMTPTEAAAVVGSVAVGNTIGRFLWGAVSDRIGKVETVKILHVLQIIFMSMLLTVSIKPLFVLALMGTTFCYGGLACILAPVTGELFGNENISANYSVAYSAYGLSALIGPLVIANIRQRTGEYTYGYIFAIGLSIVALFAALYIERRAEQIRRDNAALKAQQNPAG
jgi:OFA family oxalate/formate antiporter-like MFS transporter